MSAAIIQQKSTNNSSLIYFECGDIFEANQSNDQQELIRSVRSVSNNGDIILSEMDDSVKVVDHIVKLEIKKDPDQCRPHNALTRTISQPQPQAQHEANVESYVSTILENFGNMNLHRKLERTQSEPLPQQVNTSRYKTELCRPFEEAGECKYGEKCQFAHGYHELRNLQRHPKYKTEYCRTFHSVGFCPYGPRCHFVHNADEARALQQMQQQQQQQQQQTKLQNHSSFHNCITTYPLQTKPGNNAANLNHSLPLSPPLSMSTGSDRESPTGSLSLSPTSSMTNFTFGEQVSPVNSVFQNTFPYVNTPPESPNAPISPVNTPPPNIILGSIQNQTSLYIKPVTIQGKQVLQKSSSSPIAIIRNVNKIPTKVNSVSSLNSVEDARLPVFNRLSSAVEKFPNKAL
ncbi:protein TIS11 isoform X1 [Zeugodacus cucurbitae]|nr:protein TIS11 isoform X1 [Zeugodacus cucurbitae]XP_011187610.1 protein TIS11 isoform X1 [Zeugodacus cucurbitae]XP_028898207.1 protein TIS11 isoform X1 [Zeugodacus cucurbitae]XP_054088415.1 protein TIS11 isoform X1 [Zeugodacus cucurbitae]XP_054088416.1 protein TIS11 isoform X1 [Zeugodacus cucurbitae]XP_054088418.1 protein TIS11 isoform X1 [Zeugodacus cucurbitae]